MQFDGIDLPKMTLDLSEMTKRVGETLTDRERYEAQYKFLQKVLPRDYLAEHLLGKQLKDIDLSALTCMYMDVMEVYTEPLLQRHREEMERQAEALSPADSIIRAAESLRKSRRVFSAKK